MSEDLAKAYLIKSGFSGMQAEALSKLLDETATRRDVQDVHRSLASRIDQLETRLRAEIVQSAAEVRNDLNQSIAQTRIVFSEALAQTRSELSESMAQSRVEFAESVARARVDLGEAIARTRTELSQAIADAQTQTMRWGIGMIIAMSTILPFWICSLTDPSISVHRDDIGSRVGLMKAPFIFTGALYPSRV